MSAEFYIKLYIEFYAELCIKICVKLCIEFYIELYIKLYIELYVKLYTIKIFLSTLLHLKIKVCLTGLNYNLQQFTQATYIYTYFIYKFIINYYKLPQVAANRDLS